MMQGDRTEQREAVYHVYLQRDVVERVREAGFTDVETFGSLDRKPFQIGASGLYIVARRN
jgi:hypothetical protein